jgi:hypothetical protein
LCSETKKVKKQILRRGIYPEHGRRTPQNDIATQSPRGRQQRAAAGRLRDKSGNGAVPQFSKEHTKGTKVGDIGFKIYVASCASW